MTNEEKQTGRPRRERERQAAGRQGRRGSRRQSREARQRARGAGILSVLAAGVLAFLIGVGAGWIVGGRLEKEPVNLSAIVAPDWIDQQLLTVNPYSRPGKRLLEVNDIVVHYMGNPGTTAQQNRNYFENLSQQTGDNTVSVSSNFIVGLDGEILQCVPVDEVAYASNHRNSDTISIECCHPDETGKFTDETYDSLVRLTAWLCTELDLTEKNVIRHYDVTEKLCPLYYVEHPDAWDAFRADVAAEMERQTEVS